MDKATDSLETMKKIIFWLIFWFKVKGIFRESLKDTGGEKVLV